MKDRDCQNTGYNLSCSNNWRHERREEKKKIQK